MKRLLLLAMCFLITGVAYLWACDAQGPADPVTGLIVYPKGQGPNGGTQVPSNSSGGVSNVFKGWKKDGSGKMDIILCPVGTTLAFEGVIIGGSSRPAAWEEGAAQNQFGYTVDGAPPPVWRITGNGRGDFRGNPPPSAVREYKDFESPGDAPLSKTANQSPDDKAIWKMTYAPNTAISMMIAYLQADPVAYAAAQNQFPGLTISALDGTVRGNVSNLVFDEPCNSYDSNKVTYSDVSDLNSQFNSMLPQNTGMKKRLNERNDSVTWRTKTKLVTPPPVTTGSPPVTVTPAPYYDWETKTKTMLVGDKLVQVVKAGYISIETNWVPTGRYACNYQITPPGGAGKLSGSDFNQSVLSYTFTTPCFPAYWTFDLNSGLESGREFVWAWVETQRNLRSLNLGDQNDSNFSPTEDMLYDPLDSMDNFAVGGVLVDGTYNSGSSSSGRNTVVYVGVLDEERPCNFEWLNPNNSAQSIDFSAKTGGQIEKPASMGKVQVRVFDNNPTIGMGPTASFPKLGSMLNNYTFTVAGSGPGGGTSSLLNRHFALKDGITNSLAIKVMYNVCVPAYVGLKMSTNQNSLFPWFFGDEETGGRFVLPIQRFVWKDFTVSATTDAAKFSNFRILNTGKGQVSSLGALTSGNAWEGGSSYDVEIPMAMFTEPMGHTFAKTSVTGKIPFNNENYGMAAPPTGTIPDGVPVTSSEINYYPWSPKALKVILSANDGIASSPADSDLASIKATKFSGLAPAADTIAAFTDGAPSLSGTLSAGMPSKGGKSPFNGYSLVDWGKMAYVADVTDTDKPMLAVEVLSTKSNKAVIYSNLKAGPGQNDLYWKAFKDAKDATKVEVIDTNIGDPAYGPSDDQQADDKWTFIDNATSSNGLRHYNNLQAAIENKKFRPWAYALPETKMTEIVGPLAATNYWNGDSPGVFSNLRTGYFVESKVRLVFRYWAWDNINPFLLNQTSFPANIQPNGNKPDPFEKDLATVKLYDKPVFSGEVPVTRYWPDYIFNNPNPAFVKYDPDPAKMLEECSIEFSTQDQSGNSRLLKIFFKVLGSAGDEIIRTLEDKRQKVNN